MEALPDMDDDGYMAAVMRRYRSAGGSEPETQAAAAEAPPAAPAAPPKPKPPAMLGRRSPLMGGGLLSLQQHAPPFMPASMDRAKAPEEADMMPPAKLAAMQAMDAGEVDRGERRGGLVNPEGSGWKLNRDAEGNSAPPTRYAEQNLAVRQEFDRRAQERRGPQRMPSGGSFGGAQPQAAAGGSPGGFLSPQFIPGRMRPMNARELIGWQGQQQDAELARERLGASQAAQQAALADKAEERQFRASEGNLNRQTQLQAAEGRAKQSAALQDRRETFAERQARMRIAAARERDVFRQDAKKKDGALAQQALEAAQQEAATILGMKSPTEKGRWAINPAKWFYGDAPSNDELKRLNAFTEQLYPKHYKRLGGDSAGAPPPLEPDEDSDD